MTEVDSYYWLISGRVVQGFRDFRWWHGAEERLGRLDQHGIQAITEIGSMRVWWWFGFRWGVKGFDAALVAIRDSEVDRAAIRLVPTGRGWADRAVWRDPIVDRIEGLPGVVVYGDEHEPPVSMRAAPLPGSRQDFLESIRKDLAQAPKCEVVGRFGHECQNPAVREGRCMHHRKSRAGAPCLPSLE